MKNMKRIISLLMALMLMGSSVTASADMIVNSTGVSFSVRKMEENHQLNRFLYEVTVTDPDTKQKVTDGRFVQGKDYVFELKFQEGDHENQFTVNENGQMVYTYPEGLTVTQTPGQNEVKTNDGKVIGVYEFKEKQLVFTPYYSSDGGETFHPKGENETGKTYADGATNTSIAFHFNAKLMGDSGDQTIQFGDKVKKEWTIVLPDAMPKAEATKTAEYSETDKKLIYTVTAAVKDNPTDSLVIDDELELSEYLKGIDQSTFAVKKTVNGTETVLTPETYRDHLTWKATDEKTSGFKLDFGREEKDTTYTITYEVPIDEEKLKECFGTVWVGKNRVQVNVEGDKNADFTWWGSNVKGEKPIHKVFNGKNDQDYSRLKWKLFIGHEQNKANIAGSTVTDCWNVTEGADNVTSTTFVSGSGQITLYLADGTAKVIQGADADSYFARDEANPNGFTFTVPGTNESLNVLRCEVEYETDCEYKEDNAATKPPVTVENTADDGKGNSSSASGSAGGTDPKPPTLNAQVNKTVKRDEKGDYVYEVTVVVPKEWRDKTGFYLKDSNWFVDAGREGWNGINANPKDITIHAQGLGSSNAASQTFNEGFGDSTYQVYRQIDWPGTIFYIGFNIPEGTELNQNNKVSTVQEKSSWKWETEEDVQLTIRYTFDQNEKVLGKRDEERGSLNEVDHGYLENKAEIGGGSSSAKIDLTKAIRKSGKVSASNPNIVEYTVDINMKETSPIPTKATFTDTFSKEMEYVPDSLHVYIMAYADWGNSWKVAEVKCNKLTTGTASNGNPMISFQFDKMGSDWELVQPLPNGEWAIHQRFGSVEGLRSSPDWYRHSYAQHGSVKGYPYIQVTYQLRPKNTALKPDNPLVVNNTASVSGWSDASAAVRLTPKVLTKDMNVDTAGTTATFTLHVNPGENTLGQGRVTLNDTMQGATLLTSTITVKDSDGNAISRGGGTGQYEYQYDLATNKLTMKLPNGKHLIVTYQAKPNGISGEQVTVSNSASLEGMEDSSASTEKHFIITQTGASSSQYPIRFLINKVDQDQKPLPGAEFEVYHVRKDENEAEKWVSAGTFTSDQNGEIQIRIQEDGQEATYSNALYKIVEVKAPDRYQKAAPVYVCIEDTGNTTTYEQEQEEKFKALIKTLDGIANPTLNVVKNWGGVQIVNKQIQGFPFSFTKTDPSGKKALPGAAFTLTGENYTQTATSGENGTVNFTDLKPGKTYQLEETRAPGGYLLSTETWTIKVGENGEMTVTDGSDETVEKPESGYRFANREIPTLPSVGGRGTAGYGLLGLALMAMATAAAYTLARRKKASGAE